MTRILLPKRLVVGLLAVAFWFVASPAAAIEPALPFAWDDGRIAFVAPVGWVVAREEVEAIEGPVDLITIRPFDAERGERNDTTWGALTVFQRYVTLGDTRRATATQVRDFVVEGLRARFGDAVVGEESAELMLGGEEVPAVRLELMSGGEGARVVVAAIQSGATTVVVTFHRAHDDASLASALNEVASSLRFSQR